MTREPVDLDDRRGAAGKMATEVRRHSLKEFESDQQGSRHRQEELDAQCLAAPSEAWPEAAANAHYLIRLYAATAGAQDARRTMLAASSSLSVRSSTLRD